MSARNIPYEPPASLYDLFTRGVDRYKANYDRVFSATPEDSALVTRLVKRQDEEIKQLVKFSSKDGLS